MVWEDGGGNPASYPMCAGHGAEVPQGTVWPGWYPADDLEVRVLCGPWVWEPLAEQQGCLERSGI